MLISQPAGSATAIWRAAMLRDDSFQAEFLCNLGRDRVRSEPRNRHGRPTRSLVQYFIRSNDKLGRNCDAKLRCGRAIDSELKYGMVPSSAVKRYWRQP